MDLLFAVFSLGCLHRNDAQLILMGEHLWQVREESGELIWLCLTEMGNTNRIMWRECSKSTKLCRVCVCACACNRACMYVYVWMCVSMLLCVCLCVSVCVWFFLKVYLCFCCRCCRDWYCVWCGRCTMVYWAPLLQCTAGFWSWEAWWALV